MANWVYPVAQELTGTTKIKEADNKIQIAMDDLNDWANNTGAYSPNLGASFNYTTVSAMTDVLLTSIATDDGLRWNGTDFVNTPMYNKSQVYNKTELDASLALKATLLSPTLTGTPLAPTASVSTDNTQIATTAFVRDIIPAGIISMWSGSIVSIPSGWALCDGNNGTPNLLDRFVISAGSTYNVGATGGSKDAIAIAHSHGFSATTSTDSKSGYFDTCGGDGPLAADGSLFSTVSRGIRPGGDYASGLQQRTTMNLTHNHTLSGTTDSSGSSGTNANLPPYLALAYIMKL